MHRPNIIPIGWKRPEWVTNAALADLQWRFDLPNFRTRVNSELVLAHGKTAPLFIAVEKTV